MPAVPGVHLDAVDHQVADDHLLASCALAEVLEAGQQAVGGILLFMQDAQRLGYLGGIRAHRLEVGSRRPVDPAGRLAAVIQLRQSRSTSPRWRSRPSRLSVEGGTGREAIWAASRPWHLSSMVSR